MEIKYWAGTDVGRKRSDNEDNFLIDKRLRLFVVADGMGGHASGEIASAMAVHGIREVLSQERDILDVYDDDDPKSHVEVCTLLEYAVHHTCAQIFQKARREPEKRGMGTTLVVLLVIGARGFIAYVGDSRIYLLRGGVVYQLTEDHSLRNELIRMGKITADEFETSPYANLKNAMTRAVGVYESVEVDTLDFDIIPGDAFLLCSDGLYEYLTDDDIAHALALPDIREVPGMLIDSANSRGGKDNITAVVVQVAGDADDKDRAAELNFTLDTLKTVPLFRELSYQQLVRVINLSRQSALEPGEVLCREGERGHELVVVLRGRVELTQGGVRVTELGPGAHLGEMSLIDEGLRSVTVTALEPGKVLAIGRDDFYEVLRREPALAVKLLWSFVRVLAGRLRTTTADLAVARTTAVHVMPDLTDLAEETTRAMARTPRVVPPPGRVDELDAELASEDDEEDELERRTTLTSGMQGPREVPLEARATLVSTTTRAPEEGPPPRTDAARPRAPSGASASAEAPPAGDGSVASPQTRPRSGAVDAGVAAARARASSSPAITGDTVVAPAGPPRPRSTTSPVITGDTVAAPPPRPGSNPGALGEGVVAPPGTNRAQPRSSAAPAAQSGVIRTVSEAVPAPPSVPRPRTSSNPATTGELGSSRPVPPAHPTVSGELLPPRSPPGGPAVTGTTLLPPGAAPRPRHAPDVTKPNDAAWSPGLRPMGVPTVPSPEAPTAPLDAPHLLAPRAESDAPKARRTGRRSTLPQMPGTPLTPTPPPTPVPSPFHAAPTAPLTAPVVPPVAAPTASLAAPIAAPVMPSLAPPAAPLPPPGTAAGAPAPPVVPARRDDAPTTSAQPVVPPPPTRGGTQPPVGRGGTQPSLPRVDADSDAPRVPAPRRAVATPQAGTTQPPPGGADGATARRSGGPKPPPTADRAPAPPGGTQPPPTADGAAARRPGGPQSPPTADGATDVRRTPTSGAGSPAVPPPPPTRKGEPDDPAPPAAEPGE